MIIDKLLRNANMSRYKLSKISGVPQTTISDICNGKTSLEKCEAGTLYRIAQALNVTVDAILESTIIESNIEHRSSFDVFKSNICHYVKDMGDLDFIIDVLEHNRIRYLYDKQWYPESLYLLGMVDYLSKINGLPLCTNYNDIRQKKLKEIIYPSGVIIRSVLIGNESIKEDARKKAIPEFMRFNIVENEVRNIV